MPDHAVEDRFLQALQSVIDGLSDGKVTWALTGSMSFALQGLPFRPRDIDLQTDAAGAYEIENRFQQHMARPVQWLESEQVRSHFGALLIGGVRVEIIGDIQKRLPDGTWTPPPDLAHLRVFVEVSGRQVPVLPLDYEARAYKLMGRVAVAEQLAGWNSSPQAASASSFE